jgi:hypothetical protein
MNYTASAFKIKLAEHDISTSRDCAFMVGGQPSFKVIFTIKPID